MSTITDEQAQQLREQVQAFLQWVHGGGGQASPVAALLTEYLGPQRRDHSVVSSQLTGFDQVNLQLALQSWLDGREHRVQGLSVPPHYAGVSLQHLLQGEGLPPLHLSSPQVVDRPAGPSTTVACWLMALLLVRDARGAFVVFVRGPQEHEPTLLVEVAGLELAEAQTVLRELDQLREELDVHRGQVLEVRPAMNGLAIAFPRLPPTGRDDVVLPDAVLHRIERHTLDVARHRDELVAAGRHLKRGVLLYGPPGTGKTHTVRYLVQHLPGTTVFLLAGASLHAVGAVVDMARRLAPSALVLEDVDLVAEDRGFGPGSSPVLFELLDAMDGSDADADLTFLLTTNRADLLEPALAARPGRVDVAVEIGRPDADARRRLLAVHGRGLQLQVSEATLDEVIARTEGVTASFLKELLRRAVLEAVERTGRAVVTDEHLSMSLDDLLDSAQGVTRALLGVPAGEGDAGNSAPAAVSVRGGGPAHHARRGSGWTMSSGSYHP